MGILEKLGLAQKSKVGALSIGEKRKKEREEAANTKRVWFRWLILIGFLALLIYYQPSTNCRQIESYAIGEPWRADNLTAPFTFALQKSNQELEEERQEIISNTSPIFYVDESIAAAVQEEIDRDRKSTRLNSSHVAISYAVFCLKKKIKDQERYTAN